MLNFKVLFFILGLYFCEIVFARNCFDCVSISSCEPANNILNNIPNISPADNNTFFTSICGFQNGRAKVCCSDFDRVKAAKIEPEKPLLTTPKVNVAQRLWYGDSQSSSTKRPRISLNDSRFAPIEYDKHENAWLLPKTCGEIDGARIVGGDFAGLYEFPWMALISYNTASGRSFRCAGSVINSRYILTAAHCVLDKTGVYQNIAGVRIGEIDIESDMDCQGEFPDEICESKLQDIAVEQKIIHEKFHRQGRLNDIALLRLKDAIDLTANNAQPICLPIYQNLQKLTLETAKATVAGWGVTESGHGSSVLKKVQIPILSTEVCRLHHGRVFSNVKPNIFCAGEAGKDSCNGDSGGPLMIEAEYKDTFRLVQYGIVSFGRDICGTSTPGVYTDVTKYVGWILDNIKY